MATNAYRDENNVPAMTAVSSSDGQTIVRVYVDPSTHALSVGATVSGNVTVIQPTAASLNATVVGTGTFATQSVPTAGTTGGASFTHVAAGQATTTIKSGAGVLYAIIFSSAASATNVTTVYDNTAASGTVIAIPLVTGVIAPTHIEFGATGLAFATGLTVKTETANGGDMTFVWK